MTEPLVEELAQRPDDVELRRVFADWLLQQGHPVGELASVQLERLAHDSPELARRETELMSQQVVPFMQQLLARDHSTAWSWQRGVLETITFDHHGGEDDLVDALTRLSGDPVGRLVRRIEIRAVEFDGNGDLAPVLAQLAALAPRFVRLAELVVAEGANLGNPWIDGPIHIGDVSPIYAAYPRLEVLALDGKEYALGDIDLPALRRLVLADVSPTDIAAVARANVPALAELDLTFGRWRVDGIDAVFRSLFDRALPTLGRLSIGADVPQVMQYLVRAVPASALARHLQVLVFQSASFDDDCARNLAQWAPRLRALSRLEVRARELSPDARQRLVRALGPIVVLT